MADVDESLVEAGQGKAEVRVKSMGTGMMPWGGKGRRGV